MNKYTLSLVPASQKIDRKASSGSIGLGSYALPGTTTKLYLAPQTVLPKDKDGNVNKNAWVAPFWLVASTKDTAKVNMALEWGAFAVNGVEFCVPRLVNCKKLHANDELLRLEGVTEPPEPTGSKKRKH